MPQRHAVVLALALAALGTAVPARAQHDPAAPPPPRSFGPDQRSTGVFTGEGLSPPGLVCDAPADLAVALTCKGFLASDVDGTLLETTVRVPRSAGPHPLVVSMHGWGGSQGSTAKYDDRLTGAGYAVLRYSARGFGGSWGQTNLADVEVEGRDLRSLIGQVVDDARFAVDSSAVAVFGASYGGAHAWLGALVPEFDSAGGAPVTVRTVIPIASWTDLLNALVPNGRPQEAHVLAGAEKLSYVQALYFGGIRLRADRPYPNYPDYLLRWNLVMTANELPYATNPPAREVADGLQGYRSVYWQAPFLARVDWNAKAGQPQLPILLIQGWTDDLFPAGEALRMVDTLRALDPTYPVALYLGDIGHPRAANKPAEIDRLLDQVMAWLGFFMKGEGAQPAYDVTAAITRSAAAPFDAADVIRAPTFDALATAVATAPLGGLRLITFNPVNAGGFQWDPLLLAACGQLEPCPAAPAPVSVPGDVAAWNVPAATLSGGGPVLIAGEPEVSFTAITFAPRVQLDVRLLDVAPDGRRALVTRGTYTLDAFGRPLGFVRVRIPTFGNLWQLPADHVLRVEVTNVDEPYFRPSLVPSATVIANARLSVPVRR
jgi:predicted acyl esterase